MKEKYNIPNLWDAAKSIKHFYSYEQRSTKKQENSNKQPNLAPK